MRAFLFCLLFIASLPAQAVEVLASVRPLALIAQAVAGPDARIRQLVPDGQSGHDYSLKPSDRRLLQTAQVVLWLGPAHEHFLANATRQVGGRLLTAQSLPGLRILAQRRLDGAAIKGTVDPHLWLDPSNAALIAQAVAQALAQADPPRAAAYRARAQAFARRSQALGQQLKQDFARLPQRHYLAYHDAYQYLEAPLGLRFAGALSAGHEQQAGAKHLGRIAQTIKTQKVGCLLAEPGFDAALAQRVFNGQPGRFVAVDELFVGAASYEAGLKTMAAGIGRCLAP